MFYQYIVNHSVSISSMRTSRINFMGSNNVIIYMDLSTGVSEKIVFDALKIVQMEWALDNYES